MADPIAKERPGKTKPAKRTRYEEDPYTWVSEQVALLRRSWAGEVIARKKLNVS